MENTIHVYSLVPRIDVDSAKVALVFTSNKEFTIRAKIDNERFIIRDVPGVLLPVIHDILEDWGFFWDKVVYGY